ncbi:MAG: hypothetical protein J6A23_04515, partial [Thermoguttaceae bacterium]|nr:hypothetical protein [Thermoguttaceae bacterium]
PFRDISSEETADRTESDEMLEAPETVRGGSPFFFDMSQTDSEPMTDFMKYTSRKNGGGICVPSLNFQARKKQRFVFSPNLNSTKLKSNFEARPFRNSKHKTSSSGFRSSDQGTKKAQRSVWQKPDPVLGFASYRMFRPFEYRTSCGDPPRGNDQILLK